MDFKKLCDEIEDLTGELRETEDVKDGETVLKDIKAAVAAMLTRLKMRKPVAK